ncbi:helix-turn-helix domain-containing protein [Microlunatus antarcticus]|uniref:Uncharacterized protein n=1 Tax=Microlunatus antarcticus TaxID=53388 RepID=A0A7W5JWT4_9ACTN|nr:hypothetical protein [Microlunatus antarcticus]MBB3327670.1 hypothetical protein [Microlunatus antarcticus]
MSTPSLDGVAAFVPVSREQATALRSGDDLGDLVAYAPGPALQAAHGLGPTDEEEAGFVALGYAGLGALLTGPGLRTVLAVDVGGGQVQASGSEFGQVQLHGLTWAQVSAVFADEPDASPDLDAARALVAGRSLADVADDEEFVGLVDRWDLLWYAPAELDASAG